MCEIYGSSIRLEMCEYLFRIILKRIEGSLFQIIFFFLDRSLNIFET